MIQTEHEVNTEYGNVIVTLHDRNLVHIQNAPFFKLPNCRDSDVKFQGKLARGTYGWYDAQSWGVTIWVDGHANSGDYDIKQNVYASVGLFLKENEKLFDELEARRLEERKEGLRMQIAGCNERILKLSGERQALQDELDSL